jgi:hypothetical protein
MVQNFKNPLVRILALINEKNPRIREMGNLEKEIEKKF